MRSAGCRTIWATRWRHADGAASAGDVGRRCWTSAMTRRSSRGIRCLWRCGRRSSRAICRASLFHDLLRAFRQDQIKTQYATWEEAVEYSRYSANPVGRLVLMVCGYRDEERALLSDKICTALQLANFWQDVVRGCGDSRGDIFRRSTWSGSAWTRGRSQGRVFTPEFGAMMQCAGGPHAGDAARGRGDRGMVDPELRGDAGSVSQGRRGDPGRHCGAGLRRAARTAGGDRSGRS